MARRRGAVGSGPRRGGIGLGPGDQGGDLVLTLLPGGGCGGLVLGRRGVLGVPVLLGRLDVGPGVVVEGPGGGDEGGQRGLGGGVAAPLEPGMGRAPKREFIAFIVGPSLGQGTDTFCFSHPRLTIDSTLSLLTVYCQ